MTRRDGLLADAATCTWCSRVARSQPTAAPMGGGCTASAVEALVSPDIVEAQPAPKSPSK